MKPAVSNLDVAIYAVHLLGGASHRIPTEDIAHKCFELAPDAFSWVKFPQYPDKEVVRIALVDARKEKHGALVQGRAGRGKGQANRTHGAPSLDGWMLTEAGAKWIAGNEARLEQELRNRQGSSQRQENQRRLSRIKNHPLFQEFLRERDAFNPSLGEMAELFRCRVDADQFVWNKRLQGAAVLAQTVNDSSVLKFLSTCKASVESQLSVP